MSTRKISGIKEAECIRYPRLETLNPNCILLSSYIPKEAFMVTTLLSSKGQIVIPSSICKSHRWRSGLEFVIEDSGESIILKPIRPFASSSFSQVCGCLGYKGRKKSLEEMEKGIRKGEKTSNDCH